MRAPFYNGFQSHSIIKSRGEKIHIFDNLEKLRGFSFLGLIKYLLMRLQGKSLLVGGSCNGCGSCCRRLSLEGRNGWLRSVRDFKRIKSEYPEYQRFEMIGRDEQGFLIFNCSWCTDEGDCGDYDNRLLLCRNFPEKSLKFSGGSLPLSCGYRFLEVEPFEKSLNREIRKITNNEKNSNS